MNIRFIIVLTLACFFLSCEGLSSDGEITVYPVMCEGEMKNGVCKGMLIHLNRTVYKASNNNQTIIHWMPGVSDEPEKLHNCIVRDRKNWVGEYKDGSAKLKMINGKFQEELSENTLYLKKYKRSFYVSKWRWWYANITGGKDLQAVFSK